MSFFKFNYESCEIGFFVLVLLKNNTSLYELMSNNIYVIAVYKEEGVEEEQIEREMEIGFPTDVKHVTHIGWDGSTTINPIKGWENLKAPEIMSFPSISLKQFELAMAAQTAQHVFEPVGVSSIKIT